MKKLKFLLEHNRRDFKQWAQNDDLVKLYFDTRQRMNSPENDISYWINNKSPEDLKMFLDNFKSKTQIKKDEMESGSELLYDDDRWRIIKCTTYDAMKHYGKGSRWCIAGNYPGHENRGLEYFNDYLKNNYDSYNIVFDKKLNTKWCVCKLQLNRRSSEGKLFDIWDQSDHLVSYIPEFQLGADATGLDDFSALAYLDIRNNVLYGFGKGVKDSRYSQQELVIPENVVKIADKAFFKRHIDNIKYSGNNLKEIGYAAFAGSSLTSVIIPQGVEKIGKSAFMSCDNLENVAIRSNDLQSLPAYSFAYCHKLMYITISSLSLNDNNISDLAFEGSLNNNPVITIYDKSNLGIKDNFAKFINKVNNNTNANISNVADKKKDLRRRLTNLGIGVGEE